MKRPDFSNAFLDGRKTSTEYGEATFKNHDLGDLVLTTGRIVACDPLTSDPRMPWLMLAAFTKKVRPGSYPVTLSVAHFERDQRVAYSRILFSKKPATNWEMALKDGQDLAQLNDDEIFGYGVDSGTGCFMDEAIFQIFSRRLQEDEAYDAYLIEEMEKHYTHTWDWLNTCIEPETGSNVITFKSGWGDGCYASYFGYDSDGEVTELITDFALVD